MLYSSGMTLAGALASSIPGIMAPADGRLLSDFLPSGALYVRVSAPCFGISPAVDAALHAALRESTQTVHLI